MKAITYDKYGGPEVLELAEALQPKPNDDLVLIKVKAAAINAGDIHLMTGKPFMVRTMAGFSRPKQNILGTDISGVITEVGKNVIKFSPGDEVFADLSESGMGGFAEFVCTTETAIAMKPSGLSWEESAAVPTSGATALQALRDHGQIKVDDRVMIVGASGGVGSFAVRLAKIFGAKVTAVCSTSKIDRVKILGADHIIDYTKQDFTKVSQKFDLIYAPNGNQSLRAYKRLLASNGKLIISGGQGNQFLKAMLFGPLLSTGGKKIKGMMLRPNRQDLNFLKNLMDEGVLLPIIDRVFSLKDTAEAIAYQQAGRSQGKVVVKV